MDVQALVQWGIAKLGEKGQMAQGFDALERAFHEDARPAPVTARSPYGQWLATMIGRWHVERVAYDRALHWYGRAMAEGPPQQNDCLSMQMATLVNPYPKNVDDAAAVVAAYFRRMSALVEKPGGLSVAGVQDSDPYTYCMSTAFYLEAYLDADLREAARLHSLVALRAAQESEIPNFKGSDLGHFPLVSADSWTSDHLSERSRSVDVISVTRARGKLTLKRR